MSIENKTLDILKKYWDGYLPINIKSIAVSMGIIIENQKLTNISSRIEITENQTKIIINNNEIKTRQRFSLAHGLGHLILGHLHLNNHKILEDYPDCYTTNANGIERQANSFALAVLIPQDALLEILQNKKYSTLQQLADIFGVSQSAIYWRIQDLGLFEKIYN